jgi:AraC-like DNA-binding protein
MMKTNASSHPETENDMAPAPFVDYASGHQGLQDMRDKTSVLCELTALGASADFRAVTSASHLGSALLFEGKMSSLRFDRSLVHLGRDGIDHYQVNLALEGKRYAEFGNRGVEILPGDIAVLDMARPARFACYTGNPSGGVHQITLFLPRTLLAPLLAAPDRVHGTVVSRDTPYGRILRQHLVTMSREGTQLTLAESRTLVQAMATMLAGRLGHDSGVGDVVIRGMRQARLAAIKQHIERQLESFDLNIDTIRRIFGISRATLSRLFEEEGGLAHYIQQRRLNRAFFLLMSPKHRHYSILDIAIDSNFASDSTFVRAFRRTFGMTPGEARAAAQGIPGYAKANSLLHPEKTAGSDPRFWIQGLATV